MITLTALDSEHGFTSGDLSPQGYFAMVPAFQKMYFASGRPYNASIHSSGYHKLDFINTKLTGTASGAFTPGEVLTQASTGAKGIFDESVSDTHFVYRITTVQFNTTNVVTGADSGETVTPSAVTAPPHWLNWTAASGSFPDGGSNAMALYLGRLFMNDMYHPNQWLCTRQGDPLDLDTSQTDVGAAANSQTSLAGMVGDQIIGFIPYKNYYMIFGGASEIWILRGDPAQGGTLSNLSYEDGLFSPDSYCWDDRGNLYYLGLTGLYRLPPDIATADTSPTNVLLGSAPSLIKDLGLNRRTDRVTVAYDKDRKQVLISTCLKDGLWSTSFVYDVRTDGIYPMDFHSDAYPTCAYYHNSYSGSLRHLLIGGQDGYIRKFDEDSTNDDTTESTAAISSDCIIGPIKMSDITRGSGKISELSIDMSVETTGCNWYVYCGDTAQEVVDSIISGDTPQNSGSFTAGGQHIIRGKLRGQWFAIRLSNATASKIWGLEGIKISAAKSGRN